MSKHTIPHIERMNGHPVLIVEDKPFILLAGEVHNSDASSPAYMEHIWDIAESLGMNALLLPVSWELVEPEDDANFKRIRELHTITLQTRVIQTEATVKTAQAQSQAQYRAAESKAASKKYQESLNAKAE